MAPVNTNDANDNNDDVNQNDNVSQVTLPRDGKFFPPSTLHWYYLPIGMLK